MVWWSVDNHDIDEFRGTALSLRRLSNTLCPVVYKPQREAADRVEKPVANVKRRGTKESVDRVRRRELPYSYNGL